MANVYDYLAWRGDIPCSHSPFGEVDGMILARLAYLPLDSVMEQGSDKRIPLADVGRELLQKHAAGEVKLSKNSFDLLTSLRGCERYAGLSLFDYVNVFDTEGETQFAAVSFRIGEGRFYCSYRGTDNTLVGWKENFNMSFTTPVPAQERAVRYLEGAAELIARAEPGYRLVVGGHSKGGNLAVYASAYCEKPIQDRIELIYNFDGPGFTQTVVLSPGYQRICSLVNTLVPQSSIVGMLLEHEEKYTVVRSTNKNIWQHDPTSWELTREGFIRLESVTSSSRFIDYTIKGWMNSMNTRRREKFIDAVYQLLLTTDAKTLNELNASKYSNFKKIWSSVRNMDEQTRKDMTFALKLLVKSASLGMIRMLQDK